MLKKTCLYPVAVPIGNFEDITLRAIETLKQADLIIGEERSTTEKILKRLKIENKEIFTLNEHNEKSDAKEILNNILLNKLSVALISEAGTPCVADPGAVLVNLFHEYNLPVVPVPGVSSVMTAMMASGLLDDSFKFIGFLSANKEIRVNELKLLNTEKIPIVLLETPYRRKPLFKDILSVCGSHKKIIFAYKLTQPEELILKTTISDLINKTEELKKGEFVLIILPNTKKK